MAKGLKTGDLVLCKVGSFPPWPAVVYPQRLLRKDVYRKRRPNCVAVCFFNDPTYYWEQPHRLTTLESSVIETFLSQNGRGKSQQDLVEAYRQAQDFGSLNDFIVNRAMEEDRMDELKREMGKEHIESGEDPFQSKDITKKVKSTPSPSSSASPTLKSRRKRLRDSEDGNIHEDSDEDKATRKAHYERKQAHVDGHRDKNHGLDPSRKIEISLLFRRKLQKNLVQREDLPTDAEIAESHKMLSRILENLDNDPPYFDIEALRQSKLHKLLKVIVNDPDLEEFHPASKQILVNWSDYIAELKAEKALQEGQDIN